MVKKENLILEGIILAVIVTGLMLFFHIKNREVNLCRYLFNGLVSGNYGAARFIDWDNLKALDLDVAEVYDRLPSEKEQANYKRAFINGFAVGFSRVKARAKAFNNWRIYTKDSEETVVAADYKGQNKTLLFTLSRYGEPRLKAIQWEE
ncbi:MAG: hypothetical protein V1925_01210 [Candidatus Omnitrophota bacterium]